MGAKCGPESRWQATHQQFLGSRESLPSCIAISRLTPLVPLGDDDQTSRIWDGQSGETKSEFRGHENVVEVAVFAPVASYAAIRELAGIAVRLQSPPLPPRSCARVSSALDVDPSRRLLPCVCLGSDGEGRHRSKSARTVRSHRFARQDDQDLGCHEWAVFENPRRSCVAQRLCSPSIALDAANHLTKRRRQLGPSFDLPSLWEIPDFCLGRQDDADVGSCDGQMPQDGRSSRALCHHDGVGTSKSRWNDERREWNGVVERRFEGRDRSIRERRRHRFRRPLSQGELFCRYETCWSL